MKNIRLEGVLDGLGRNMKAAFEPEFPGQSSAQQEAKDIQNTISFWRLFLMQVCKRLLVLYVCRMHPSKKHVCPAGQESRASKSEKASRSAACQVEPVALCPDCTLSSSKAEQAFRMFHWPRPHTKICPSAPQPWSNHAMTITSGTAGCMMRLEQHLWN